MKSASLVDEFPPAQEQEHGHRYIRITPHTRAKDARNADNQNRKLYNSYLEAKRKQGLYVCAVSYGEKPKLSAAAPPPFRPTTSGLKATSAAEKRRGGRPSGLRVQPLEFYLRPFREYRPEGGGQRVAPG